MSKTKQISHSPAPWRTIGAAVLAADGKQVAATYPQDVNGDPIRSIEEDDANLFLICAAPALKAALEKAEAAMSQLLSAAVMAPKTVRQFPPFALGENMVDDALANTRQALALANNGK